MAGFDLRTHWPWLVGGGVLAYVLLRSDRMAVLPTGPGGVILSQAAQRDPLEADFTVALARAEQDPSQPNLDALEAIAKRFEERGQGPRAGYVRANIQGLRLPRA